MNRLNYYWIKTKNIINPYVPMCKNVKGKWIVDMESCRVFLSDYKLQLLFGRDCILREVDFDEDLRLMDNNLTMFYYFIEENGTVFYGNAKFFYLTSTNSIHINDFKNCRKLVYKTLDTTL